jgi:hypothetical protein
MMVDVDEVTWPEPVSHCHDCGGLRVAADYESCCNIIMGLKFRIWIPLVESTLPSTEMTATTSNALSRTSKVGIGLGAPFGVLLIAATIGAFTLHRRKRRHEGNQEVSVIDQARDDLDPLPTTGYHGHHHTRMSQTETVTSFSQLSSGNRRSAGTEKQLSELMSTERVAIGWS